MIKQAWQFPDQNDLPPQEFELRILTSAELPRPNIAINETLRGHGCGAWDGMAGETDSLGVAHITLAPPIVARLDLIAPSGPSRALSPEEMHVLFSEKRLTVHW